MAAPPRAVFRFFSKTTCGYCKIFKGEGADGKINPNSGWEILTSDQELLAIPIKFTLYQFGPEKDPATGKMVTYALEEKYAHKVRGVPYLELYVPNDPDNGRHYDMTGLTGWDAEGSVQPIKKWILAQMQTEPFKSYVPGDTKPPVQTPVQKALPASAPVPGRGPAIPQAARPATAPVPAPVYASAPPVQSQQQLLQRVKANRNIIVAPKKVQAPAPLPEAEETEEVNSDEERDVPPVAAPTTAGLATRPIQAPVKIETPAVQTPKKVSRFLPSNHDD